MRRIARRFSSPVITAIVVGLVVGGTTAAAAPSAVTSVVKFAKRATFAKRAGKATRAKYATNAATAKKANYSKNAGFANNTASLGGHPASDYARGPSTQKIDFRAKAGTGETTLLDTGKLVITASCDSSSRLRVLASTKVDHADLESLGNGGDTRLDDFTIAASPRNIGPTSGEYRDVIYTDQSGQTVYVHFLATSKAFLPSSDTSPNTGPPLGGAVDCLLTGFAMVQ